MARIRSVHPDLCASETMAALPAELERTFVRLWTHCDDEGRCEDRPRLIKAGIYPEHDDMTWERVDAELDALKRNGLICRYVNAGKRYIAITSWDTYQHPQRPKESKYPAPPDPSDDAPPPTGHRDDDSTSRTRHIRDESAPLHGLELGEGEGEGEGGVAVSDSEPSRALVLVPPNGSSPPAKVNGYTADFEDWWNGYPRKVAKHDASKAWAKAVRIVTPGQLTQALEACKRSWQARGRATEYIPHAATWLNGHRWEDDLDDGPTSEPRGFAGIREALARMSTG